MRVSRVLFFRWPHVRPDVAFVSHMWVFCAGFVILVSCSQFRLVVYLAVLAGRWVGWLVGRLVRSVGCLVGWLVRSLVGSFVWWWVRSFVRSFVRLIVRSIV